jgi:hypothetical protein
MQIPIHVVDEEAGLALRYRIALSDWSFARFHYASDSPQVIEATEILEKTEQAFRMLSGTCEVRCHRQPGVEDAVEPHS